MPLATLSIDLVAKLANLEDGLNRAQYLAQKNAQAIKDAFESTRDTISSIGRELVEAYSVHAFVELIKGAIDAQEELVKLAHQTQLTVTEVGGLKYASEQAGGSADTLTQSVAKLNVQIAKAVAGDATAAEPFKKMNVELRNLDGSTKSGLQALLQLSERFNSYTDGPKKAALAQAEFSRGYKEVLALLAEGPDQIQHNIDFFNKYSGITAESTAAAKEFKDRLGELHVLTGSFAVTLANDLVPGMTALVNTLIQVKEGSTATAQSAHALGSVFNTLIDLGADVVGVLINIGQALATVASTAAALYDSVAKVGEHLSLRDVLVNPFSAALQAVADVVHDFHPKSNAINEAYQEDINNTWATIRKFQSDLKASTTKADFATVDFGKGSGWNGLKEAPDIDPKARANAVGKAIDSYIKKLQDQTIAAITAGDAMSHLEKAQFELIVDPKLSQANPAIKQWILETAKGLDDIAFKFNTVVPTAMQNFRKAEIGGTEGVNEALRQATNIQAEAFHNLIAAAPDAKLEETRRVMKELADAFESGAIDATQFSQAAQARLGTLPENFARVTSELEDLAVQAAHGINDALGTGLEDLLGGKFSSIAGDFGHALEKMAAKAIATDLGNLIFGKDFLSGGGGLGGLLTTIFPSLAGFGSKNALGGGVPARGISEVAEYGPETFEVQGKTYLLNGSKAGVVKPAGAGASGQPIIFQIAAGVTRNELVALVPQLTATIKAQIFEQQRRPGFVGA